MIVSWTNRTPGLSIAVYGAARRRESTARTSRRASNTQDERIGLIDQDDIDVVRCALRKQRRKLQAAKPRTGNHDAHGASLRRCPMAEQACVGLARPWRRSPKASKTLLSVTSATGGSNTMLADGEIAA